MHKTAVVRSVFHNGGCHKNLPMYTGFDVNLPDEDFRDTDPPSMGSVCAYLERESKGVLPPYVYLPCSLGWGKHARRLARMRVFWESDSIRFALSAQRLSTTLPTTCGSHKSCEVSRTWEAQISRRT